MTEKTQPPAGQQRPVEIVFDDEPLSVPEKGTTPNSLLDLAGLDTSTHYVVELKGRDRESYKDRGEELIKVHKGQRFVSVSTQPTPTS